MTSSAWARLAIETNDSGFSCIANAAIEQSPPNATAHPVRMSCAMTSVREPRCHLACARTLPAPTAAADEWPIVRLRNIECARDKQGRIRPRQACSGRRFQTLLVWITKSQSSRWNVLNVDADAIPAQRARRVDSGDG